MLLKRSYIFAALLHTISIVPISSNMSFWLPKESSLRFHDNEAIKLKPNIYKQFLAKWETMLNNTWKKLLTLISKETEITLESLEAYLQDESLGKLYILHKEKEILESSEYIHEEDIDPLVLNFIKRTLAKYCTKKNIKVVLSPNLNTITATFGTDQNTHYIICHASVYTKEHVQHYYDALANNNGVFYIEPYKNNKIRFIELSNLLLIGIIESASHIQHQNNLLTFLLSSFKFANKSLSPSTIQLCWHVTEIRSMLESIIQSKNPLESALFVGQVRKRTPKERKLWKNLIQDLSECYSASSLKTFKNAAKEINDLYLQ